jgi:hypothetical protein
VVSNRETGSALGAALQASYKLVVSNRETGNALGAALQASYNLVVSNRNRKCIRWSTAGIL